jgi:membrane-associated phospholipid phosphatase
MQCRAADCLFCALLTSLLLFISFCTCRPDFLSRCMEAGDMQAVNAGATINGLQQQPGCTNMDDKKLYDGRMSFPSGHSSCSMAVGLFAALYMLWTLHWREGGALQRALLRPASNVVGRMLKDVASLAVLLVLLFQLAWPWGVALSRFMDNRHNPSDVVGGLLLAISFVPVFVVRVASSVGYQAEYEEWSVQEQQEQEQKEQEQQLLEQEQQQHVQPQVVIQPVQDVVVHKQMVHQHPVFVHPRPVAEQTEVQLTIQNSGSTPQDSDASSAVVSGRHTAVDTAGQAVPAVASGAGSV